MSLLADIVLVIHFWVVIFIISGFFLIPIGYKLNWKWITNKKLRLFHVGTMTFVTLETFLGVTCPLTTIENSIRNVNQSDYFVSYWIKQIIYWDFPTIFFIISYSFFLGWTLLLWKLCPPQKNKQMGD
tara:strand:+ start:4228 stop:4611 length:384 start_codon:yes stop_codon:yes gene_type:complete